MNIAITGQKGLIGNFLKKRLDREGHKIILEIDRREERDVSELENYQLKEKVDMFIHLADFCKINKIIENPDLGFNNAKNLFVVLEFCRKNKIPKIVFFSSSRVLNEGKNPYTASKLFGEELCKVYSECYNIKYLIIRPSTVYGPVLDYTKRLMHIFISNALQNKPLEVLGDPQTKTLDFTYVEDFVDGVMTAINHEEWNKTYNISGGEHNVFELAKFIISEIKSNSQIMIKDKEISQPQQVRVDNSEIEKLGFKTKISLHEGIRRNIEVYKKLFEEDPRVFDY
jgi:nucleoside-diphosphate-sugar epimerase